MSLYKYRILETVVREGSFVNAAAALNLTPSAVSHAILKLEKEFGISLFNRNCAKLSLTYDGEQILPYICSILRSEEGMNNLLAEMKGMQKGILRIGTVESITKRWFPEIINNFRKKFPKIEVKMLEGVYDEIEQWIKLHFVDISFMSSNYSEHYKLMPLCKDEMMCVAPRDFKPKNEGYVTAEEFGEQTVLLQKESDDCDSLRILRKYGVEPKQVFRMDTNESTVIMAACGFGVGILPRLACYSEDEQNVKFYRFEPREYRTIGLVFTNEKMPSRAAVEFKKMVEEYIEKYGLNNIESP